MRQGLFAAAFLWGCTLMAGETLLPDTLKGLKIKHPRLIALDEDWAALKAAIQQDKLAGDWHTRLLKEADDEMKKPPIEHKLIGPRLLDQSRAACRRVSLWAALYRLNGGKQFADRAIAEMLTAAKFKDWNPSHFLDTAEMSWALGIGYDWLYDVLSDDDRKTIRAALVEKGLKPGLEAYEKKGWWPKCTHNWNQVCNGGLLTGALAIADEEPAIAAQIVAHSRQSIPLALASYAPDGGWAEGPGYWGYATQYTVNYLAALQSAFGNDGGLSKLPGMAETGMFRIYAAGPTGKNFNFADAGEGAGRNATMFWLAHQYRQPAYAAYEMQMLGSSTSVLHFIFGFMQPPVVPAPLEKLTALPLDAQFPHVHVAFFRSAWNDPHAVFAGFKGGDNKANHSHLDLGTFVLDAGGERFASDLGGDNYNLPGYFGKQRWTYYRLKTAGHNTLVLDGENQDPKAQAPLLAFQSRPERAFAVADLSAAYKAKASRVLRGLALLERRDVLVQDEIEAAKPVDVAWSMHTKAKVELKGRDATLTAGKAKLAARILEPEDAKFETKDANPPEPEAQNKDVTKLMVRLPEKITRTRIVVLFSPVAGAAPQVEPLEKWLAAAKQ
ncbi:MAG: heparinase II/III family protein [Planctomycetota bacterium]